MGARQEGVAGERLDGARWPVGLATPSVAVLLAVGLLDFGGSVTPGRRAEDGRGPDPPNACIHGRGRRVTDLLKGGRCRILEPRATLQAVRTLLAGRWSVHVDPFTGPCGTVPVLVLGHSVRERGSGQRWKAMDARRCVPLAPGSRLVFRVGRVSEGAVLSLAVGALKGRRGGSVRICRGETCIRRAVEARWEELALPIRNRASGKILVTASGPADSGVCVAQPVVLEQGCRAGPNFIFVVLDSVHADAVDLTGRRGGWTPNLRRLAARGTSWSHCRAVATRTRASVTAMLTATPPWHLGLAVGHDRIGLGRRRQLHAAMEPRLATLALRRMGYETAAFGDDFYLLGATAIGLDRGFGRIVYVAGPPEAASRTIREVIQALKRMEGRSFFFWVHLQGGHAPYRAPSGCEVPGARAPGAPGDAVFARYLAAVSWADDQLGLLLDFLEESGLSEETYVVVTSDHGEVFADAHSFLVNGTPTRHHHGWSAYEEVLRVPLVVAGPGILPGGRVQGPVSHLDLWPTLFGLAGLPAPGSWAGGDLFRPRRRLFAAQAKAQWAILDGEWKLIRRFGPAEEVWTRKGLEVRKVELYNLSRDPLETRNLAGRHAQVASRLLAAAKRIFQRRVASSRGRSEGRLCFASGGGKSPRPFWVTLVGHALSLARVRRPVRVSWDRAGTAAEALRFGLRAGGLVCVRFAGRLPRAVCRTASGTSCWSRARLGAYGLSGFGQWPEAARVLAATPGRPVPGPGLAVWIEGSALRLSPVSIQGAGGRKEVDLLLRQWGYASSRQRKEAHGN